MGVAMAMRNMSMWKWDIIGKEPFVSIGNSTNISMPRICDIDMTKGIVIIEERFLKNTDEEGDKFTLSLHLASSDGIRWITNQIKLRAKSPY